MPIEGFRKRQAAFVFDMRRFVNRALALIQIHNVETHTPPIPVESDFRFWILIPSCFVAIEEEAVRL